MALVYWGVRIGLCNMFALNLIKNIFWNKGEIPLKENKSYFLPGIQPHVVASARNKICR